MFRLAFDTRTISLVNQSPAIEFARMNGYHGFRQLGGCKRWTRQGTGGATSQNLGLLYHARWSSVPYREGDGTM